MKRTSTPRCYIYKAAGIKSGDSRTMSRIKVAGRNVYVHTDECLRLAKAVNRISNQFTNKFKRVLHSLMMQILRTRTFTKYD